MLDLGTGTGVLPRNMHRFGAKWTGTDISPEQIEQAKKLSQGMGIGYYAMSAEKIDFPDDSFDATTACQCFWYFDHEKLIPQLCRMLKSNGRLLVLCMEWLPFEDKIAGMSEDLVLRYSPDWSGAGETMHPIEIPACYKEKFELVHHEEWKLKVHFTRESWNGRMKACRGIGASLTPEEIENWEREHLRMLREKRTRGVRCSPLRRHGGAQEKRLIKSNPTRNFRRVGFLRCTPTRIRNAQSSLYTKISCPGTTPGREILLFTSNYRSSANHSNSNAPV